MAQVTCTECSKETTVPFEPTPGKPVYCNDCFRKRRAAGPPAGGPGGRGGGSGGRGGPRRDGPPRQKRRFERHEYPGYDNFKQ